MDTTITKNPVSACPSDLRPNDRLGFKIIAVIGHDGDWTAYRGLSHWSDQRTAEQGDKISKEAAEALFYAPVAAELVYSS